jgi:import receptor subunit TOM22
MTTNVCFIFVFQDLDETLSERLWGLTELFPEGVRNITSTVVSSTCTGVKGYVRFHSQ